MEEFIQLFNKYGAVIIFVITYLEHLNLPGFPAIILIGIGAISYASDINFVYAVFLSVSAGVLGSLTVYFISRFAGAWVLELFGKKNKTFKKLVDKSIKIAEYKNYIGLIIIRLIPMVRTISSIPSGMLKLPILKFTIYTTIGIFIFNTVGILAGYIIATGVFR